MYRGHGSIISSRNEVTYLNIETLFLLLLILFFTYTTNITLSMIITLNLHSTNTVSFIDTTSHFWPPPIALANLKLLYAILICSVAMSKVYWYLDLTNGDGSHTVFKALFLGCNRFQNLILSSLLWIFGLNAILITIINPSLLNPGPSNSLSILYQNVQGLIPFSHLGSENPLLDMSKILELQSYAFQNSPDLIVLNETWLKPSVLDNEILPSGHYQIFRVDRSKKSHPPDPIYPTKFRRNGGGVLIAIKTDLDFSSSKIQLPCGAEILALKLTTSNGDKIVVCTCYRVGTLGLPNHRVIIEALSRIVCKKRLVKTFIVGDFNLREVSWSSLTSPVSIEQTFVDSFVQMGLKQCISVPTHDKGNILDILLTNSEQSVLNPKVLDKNSVCKSDHSPFIFSFRTIIKRKKSVKRECYKFSHANWDALNSDLRNTNWNSILSSNDPEICWTNFKSCLFSLVDIHIPKVKVKTDFQPPWFDAESYVACRKKDRLRAKFKETETMLDELKWREARRDYKKLARQKTRDNLSLNADDDSGAISKKFWSYVKSSSNSFRIPESMSYNNTFRNDALGQAELFNTFFYEQFSAPSSYDIDIDFSDDNRFNIDFHHSRIRKILLKINSNKARGPDNIHGKILKHCAVSIAFPLSCIFKLSYNCGYIPKEWKLANVVPVYKKGSKSSVENYRPISLTCLVMKVFERIIKDELLFHTESLLNPKQHGFLSNRSCTTNMVDFTNSLALSLNEQLRTDVIYFDFAKAFDSVNHDIILHKLKHKFKINGTLLKFLVNYLKDRQQRVVIGNTSSSYKSVNSGVPQGSIIGPLLFVLFINDLSDELSTGTEAVLYADDTKIWRVINSSLDHEILQKDVDCLQNWANDNLMRFHPGKCKILTVTSEVNPLLFSYSLGGIPLNHTPSEKDLGVDITPTLNFQPQCDRLISKANQKFGLLRRTCFFLSDKAKCRSLYIALVRSQFENCSIVWRPCTKVRLAKFEGIQKSAIKWMLSEENISYNSSYSLYLKKCKEVNLLPITYLFDLNQLLFFHKIVYEITPVKLPYYLSFYQGSSRLRSSHMDHLCLVCSIIPRTISNAFSRSFFYKTHRDWNMLPLKLREISDICEFKEHLIKHLWKVISEELLTEGLSDDSFIE